MYQNGPTSDGTPAGTAKGLVCHWPIGLNIRPLSTLTCGRNTIVGIEPLCGKVGWKRNDWVNRASTGYFRASPFSPSEVAELGGNDHHQLSSYLFTL